MLHRAPFGSLERFVAVLIEHCAGNFPLWLMPEQFIVLPISEKYEEYAKSDLDSLNNNDICGLIDLRDEKIGRKIRDAEIKKIPYMLVIGEKEMLSGIVSVRKHSAGDVGEMTISEFSDHLQQEIKISNQNWRIIIRPKLNPNRSRRVTEPLHNINKRIRAKEVRVVGEDVEQGVYPIERALEMAIEMDLDLVEISPNAVPPVCKIVDYNKFVYEQKKKLKEIKSNAKQTVIKEIRFGPNTSDHDFQFKLKHAVSFLEAGEKVRAYVHFKGRAIVYKEQGEILLLKFAQALEDVGKVELLPKLEGKRMFLTVAPKSLKK